MTVVEAIQLAFSHYQAGRQNEAIHVCRAILAAVPGQPETLQLLAAAEFAAGQPADAIRHLHHALAQKPDAADLYSNFGVVQQSQGFLMAAMATQTRACRLNPDMAEAYINRGSVLLALGNRDAAAEDFARAVALKPDDPQPINNLGAARRDQGRIQEAVAAHRLAIALGPDRADPYRDLAHVLRETGGLVASRDAYLRAYRIDPSKTEALSYHLFVKQVICDWQGYDALCRSIGEIIDTDRGLVLPLATLAIDTTPAQQYRAACHFYRTAVRPNPAAAPLLPCPAGDGRLRIAYFSADFHEHATAYLAAEMFELHDRKRFQVLAYSFGQDDGSPMRRRLLNAFDVFRDIRSVGLDEVTRMVAADGVDILVDLKGYTKQSRLELLRQRLAPVQATYLGYPGTTGSEFIDYNIGDRFVTPPEHAAYYTEKLVVLPDAYQINDRHRPVAEPAPSRAECGLPDHGFVFCSFNTTYKITPAIFDVWMRLLAQVPGSVLWLFEANRDAVDNLRRAAAARGVDPDRVIFAPKRPLAEHLARYRLADLFVDTLPYTGHTTTSDALWAGLPVVTCLGDSFAARVAAGLLAAAGLPELIAPSLDAYEALALRLVRDPDELAGYRRRLVETRMTVPLFDSRRFTRHIERAYTMMWDIHQAGQPPRAFAVPPLPPGTPL